LGKALLAKFVESGEDEDLRNWREVERGEKEFVEVEEA
jgi:hypothetical protein